MPDTVKLPIIGQANKGVVVAGGLAAIGVGAYVVYKHLKSKSTPATPATGAASQYGYGTGYAYGYGSEPYGYGSYTYDGNYGYGGGGGGLYGGGSGGYPGPGTGGYGNYGYGTGGTPAPVTNAQWAQAATQALSQQGYNTIVVSAALGLYLSGGAVSQNQAQIIQAAIGIAGNPPQPGANGYPPAINQGGGGGGGGQGGGGQTIAVPNVIGFTAGAAHNAIDNAGLHAVADSGQKATWIVSYTQPSAGTKLSPGDNVLIQAAPGNGKK